MGILKKYPAISYGIFITVIFLALGYFRADIIDTLELKYYDIRMMKRGEPESESKVVIVDIDDESIEKLGRWPWPRSRIAEGISKISNAGPRVIGLNIIYSEPSDSTALRELQYLTERLKEQTDPNQPDERISRTIQAIEEARTRLDNDQKLVKSVDASDNVMLPIFFKISDEIVGSKEKRTALMNYSIQNVEAPESLECPEASEIVMPLPDFLQASEGIGHVNLLDSLDIDGKVRKESLLYTYDGLYIPSFSLRLAALYLGVPGNEIQITKKPSVSAGLLDIPITPGAEFLINFKGGQGSFKRYPFYDVINDKIPASILKNKIVLITPSAAGILNPISTSTAQAMSVGEFTANTIWAMLNRKFIRQPSWGNISELVIIFFTGILITLLLPRLKAIFSATASCFLLVFLIVGSSYLFIYQDIWIPVTYPFLQLIFGYIGVLTIKYFVTETRKEKIEEESAETNRMLGLSFQSQGQLDMAFDKFRKVPVDKEMKGIFYNLGLDYERKRQLNKAAAVYEYIEEYDPDYKDISTRKKKLLQASETMVFGDGFLTGAGTSDGLLTQGSDTRPTLGRYEIMKQLGKGAMGVVYLGQDPRINRTTAIKTFRFTDDFEPEEVKAMKEKFFREAESAGTLSHPNIVTIYDAGDEQDLAYIAMEYLEGDDMQKYTRKNSLLPMRKVLDYVGDVADALNYAHEKGIVHRDIKPANIMLLKTDVIKITDFGIARITASSQTQTGVVKGTPHYMSPEQISGEKVDGRSDIFSLGAMLFQLLTGDVPFHGDSPAALLHQIMNVRQPDARTLNPKLSKAHVTIINKAMEKDRAKRYQKASQMALHLRTLGKKIDVLMQQKKKAV
ncbi:serine/threonine-protein kinase [Desulfococcaceae bacterium HSG8]|nr:serine/threonine-protein kinase [Desulfococcaceae bacterium HSG8]